VTDLSGIGPIELATLRAVDAPNARRPAHYLVSSQAVREMEAATGLGPRYAYDVLLDLARPWMINVPLIDPQGNIGDLDFPAVGPRHTECRPSGAGYVILDAEAGRIAPVPAGLINGTSYRGGTQPPLHSARLLAAIRHLLAHPRAPDRDILAIVGPPHSVADCAITGDLDDLAAGRPVTLRQTGRITRTSNPVPAHAPDPVVRPPGHRPKLITGTGMGFVEQHSAKAHFIIESLPAGVSPSRVGQDLAQEASRHTWAARDGHRYDGLPIEDVADLGNSRIPVRLAITLRPGSDPDTAREQLANFEGITTQSPAAYPSPLATLLRSWTRQHHRENTASALASFENAIEHDRDTWR
jgi:hypothetical protein